MTRSIPYAAHGRAGTTLFIALAVLLGVMAQQQTLAAPVGLGAKTEISDDLPVQANGLVLAHHKGHGHKKYTYKRGHKKGYFKHGHGRGFKKFHHGRDFKKFRSGRGFKTFKHGRSFKKFRFGKFRGRRF